MNVNLAIGGRIKQIRHSHCMTQEDLAKQLGLTKDFISKVENGKQKISVEGLHKICQIFGYTLRKFFDIPTLDI